MKRIALLLVLALCAVASAHAQTWVESPGVTVLYEDGSNPSVNVVEDTSLPMWQTSEAEVAAIGQMYPGTAAYHQTKCNNASASQQCYAQIDAATLSALQALNPSIFTGTGWSTTTSSPGTSAAYCPPGLFNPGLHKQVVFYLGDSIGNYMAQNFQQVLFPYGVPLTQLAVECGTWGFAAWATRSWATPWSRLVLNLSRGGWYLFPLTAVTGLGDLTAADYLGRGAWTLNQAMFTSIPIAPGQQVVFVIELGTNDYDADGTASPLYGSPADGSPDLVTYGIEVLIGKIKAAYPNVNGGYGPYIVVQTPIGRWWGAGATTTVANQAFLDFGAYIAAHMAALKIDVLINYQYVTPYDPANDATISTDPQYYLDVSTHPSFWGAQTTQDPPIKQALDALQFGTVKSLPGPLFAHQ